MKKYTYASKIEYITIFQEDDFIVRIQFSETGVESGELTPLIEATRHQIDEYLEGLREKFTIPYKFKGSIFQTQVLEAIANIKYGVTISYKELSICSGNPRAFRAVGTVCKSNPLPLLIPCHRVIKSNGEIGFYNGGQVMKKRLLELENK